MKITLYLDVTSSWCFWAQPAWEELKSRFEGRVEFDWKIALMDATGIPKSAAQLEWYYRRSGHIMGSPDLLNTGWFEAGRKEYVEPNVVAEAAKDFGVRDDSVRLALARAALIDGKRIGHMDECIEIACDTAILDPVALRQQAESAWVTGRVRQSTAEFHALGVTQRPAYVIENKIDDRAVLCGIASAPALITLVEAMLHDENAYAEYAVKNGKPPKA